MIEMTNIAIEHTFELQTQLQEIVRSLATINLPANKNARHNQWCISKIIFEDGQYEVQYSIYRGCNEYDSETKYFSLQDILAFVNN